jgi:hypothetical protein
MVPLNRRGKVRCHSLPDGSQCPSVAQEPGDEPAQCPHPEKARYATWEGAWKAAWRRPAVAGLVLWPYRCACSWVHLTKREPMDRRAA